MAAVACEHNREEKRKRKAAVPSPVRHASRKEGGDSLL